LVIFESGLFTQEFFEDAYFFLQIFDHLLLAPIHPTSEAEKYKH